MSLFNELQDQMIKYRFRPDRKLGQHFVVLHGKISSFGDIFIQVGEFVYQDSCLKLIQP